MTVAQESEPVEEIIITGTRIKVPGVESSSPIYSVSDEEIALQQQPEVERILRLLPITKPGDGQNRNNGSAGTASIDLRGLGTQRNLVLIDGKRVTPYDINGVVDSSTIPTALVDRIDIITGGASAVYGSDAISGALNFILKRDFEGVDLQGNYSVTEEGDGDNQTLSLTVGSNVADGRGNVVLGLNWTERDAVLLGQRPLGLLGIDTASGANYAEFLAGQGPQSPPAGCGGPNSVASGGSTTTLPTRVAIAGVPGTGGQFRDDGTLQENCSVFNFNPFNYYQTPLERFGGTALGHFEINEHAEVYTRLSFSALNVRTQVAPSGVFGTTFFTPLANPLMSDQARSQFLAEAEAARIAGALNVPGTPDPNDPTSNLFANWRDINSNGIVDVADDLLISYRRRTVEFGERSTGYDTNAFQFVVGTRGTIVGDWNYDISFQRGESDRTNTSAGYTNIANIANAINSVDGVTCRTGGSSCVPINLFGGFGSITPEMAAYSSAVAIEQRSYEQTIYSGSVSGPIDALQVPWADSPIAVSIGAEYREEIGSSNPDECWKLAPSSCLGGAGGNRLPISGGFDVSEAFFESIIPLVSGKTGFEELSLELGFRTSDYDPSGSNETWKAGISWRPIESLRFRAMVQQAVRAPNVGELSAPTVTALRNATLDPCSVANPNIDATLSARCIATGMTAAQVGAVEDIVSGQINTFEGTDLANLPKPETADTLTAGFVFTPDFELGPVEGLVLSVDYYDIDIDDVIGIFNPQEVLDGCYLAGLQSECDKIVRIGGGLTLPGSGVERFTTNLVNLHAEGVEVGAAFAVDLGEWGDLDVSANYNQYLTQESQSSATTPVLDCLGFYGTSCGGPLPKSRWIQRTSWNFKEDFTVSYLWRHIGSVDIEPSESAAAFPAFRSVGSVNYIDLTGNWRVTDHVDVTVSIQNLLGEDPPVVGNEAASTSANSGNTFPSQYDVLGAVYTFGFRYTF
ncbi:MAG: TonB-dependent receptor [Woeseiaceae bacterium]|nr:TonB-dependent receptor [Woeseiaceae bacterium]